MSSPLFALDRNTAKRPILYKTCSKISDLKLIHIIIILTYNILLWRFILKNINKFIIYVKLLAKSFGKLNNNSLIDLLFLYGEINKCRWFRGNSNLLCSKASGSIFNASLVLRTVLHVHDILKIAWFHRVAWHASADDKIDIKVAVPRENVLPYGENLHVFTQLAILDRFIFVAVLCNTFCT